MRGTTVLILAVLVVKLESYIRIQQCFCAQEKIPQRTVTFIPFPYKVIGSGEQAQCTWETRSDMSTGEHDLIQRAAFAEGLCFPSSSGTSLHVFSTREAIACLSSEVQKENMSIAFAGDSYTMHLFIGLADILLGRAWNIELDDGKTRRNVLMETKQELQRAHAMNPAFPSVEFVCDEPCYGSKQPFSKVCSQCIVTHAQNHQNLIPVVGAGVHVLHALRGHDTVNRTTDELISLLDMVNQSILVSMPSYQLEKVPPNRINFSYNTQSPILYNNVLSSVSPNNRNRPFLDVFQLTKSCIQENCSNDGGHRHRFVNRWKAQLLLNTICEVI
jgi:hypothetical protein